VGAELFHPEGRMKRQTDEGTDMKKLTVACPNFAKAPEKEVQI